MDDPVVSVDGFTLYPVRHALGAIVYSFSEESQRLWQELADRQTADLDRWMKNRITTRSKASPIFPTNGATTPSIQTTR